MLTFITPLRNLRTLHNPDSACDYGEYPLSFAASVGSVAICRVLTEHAEHEMHETEWLNFVADQVSLIILTYT